jgi:arginine/lysine/ornithine decarboxylase
VEGLYKALTEYGKEDYYPMHMPGHKRNTQMLQMVNPYSIDITEIEGFDDLHQPEGILKDLSGRLQKLYGAAKSFPLVNGSTAGILAGISAAVKAGERILMARNCHKAVYHAVLLRGLKPVYLYPEKLPGSPVYGGISASSVERLLKQNPGIGLVVITSPTYEGIVSDIEEIARITHEAGALLLVDEAHGAHFGFHEAFPQSAVTLGADIVIQSLHKTLPSFTQTAVLHSNRPELDAGISRFLSIYESSSPSYLLMAGMDLCVRMLEKEAGPLFDNYYKRLDKFYEELKSLRNLRLLDQSLIGGGTVYALDPSKLVIQILASDMTGPWLAARLRREYHIVMELEARDYVLGMTSICDTNAGFDRLSRALRNIDGELRGKRGSYETDPYGYAAEIAMEPFEAAKHDTEWIRLSECGGRISASFISIYPPGIPLLIPGERLDEKGLRLLKQAREDGLKITGLQGEDKDMLEVVRKE